MDRERLYSLLVRRECILVLFVLSALLNALTGSSDARVPVAGLIFFPLLAWFAYKRKIVAIWTTVLLLLFIGSGFLYDSVSVFADEGVSFSLLLALKLVLGVFLTWGALILHRERHLD